MCLVFARLVACGELAVSLLDFKGWRWPGSLLLPVAAPGECEPALAHPRNCAAACRSGQLAGPSGRLWAGNSPGAPLRRLRCWPAVARSWQDRDARRSAACCAQQRPCLRCIARAAGSQVVATSVLVEEAVEVGSPEHRHEAARGGRDARSTDSLLQSVHSVLLEVGEGLEDLVWSADGFTPLTVKPWPRNLART